MMTLTDNQRAVLAHVVPDPDAWLADVLARYSEAKAAAMLVAKVAKWSADYNAASALPGYKTRAERMAEAGE